LIYFGTIYKKKEIATVLDSFAKIEPMENKMSAEFFFGGAIWIVCIGLAVSLYIAFTTKDDTSWRHILSMFMTLVIGYAWLFYIEDVLKFFGIFD